MPQGIGYDKPYMKDQTSSLVFLHYLTTVFDAIEDSILLIGIEPDGRHKLLMANESLQRTTGFPSDSIGKYVEDVVGPEAYKTLQGHYQDALAAQKPIEYTEWANPPSGRKAYHVRLIPIMNSVGECVQLAVAAQDVTELETLRDENKTLRKKLQARTPA